MSLISFCIFVAPYTPVGSVDTLFPGTWYLTKVDDMHRRQYERSPLTPTHPAMEVDGAVSNCPLKESTSMSTEALPQQV